MGSQSWQIGEADADNDWQAGAKPAEGGKNLGECGDRSHQKGGLDQDDTVRLGQTGDAGHNDGRCDATDDHGQDMLQ